MLALANSGVKKGSCTKFLNSLSLTAAIFTHFLIPFSFSLTFYYGFITCIDFPFFSCYTNKWR